MKQPLRNLCLSFSLMALLLVSTPSHIFSYSQSHSHFAKNTASSKQDKRTRRAIAKYDSFKKSTAKRFNKLQKRYGSILAHALKNDQLIANTTPSHLNFKMPESPLAHQMLDGLRGIEIGGSIHNQFGLNTLNVDYTDDNNTAFKQGEFACQGTSLKVDIVANGDDLPFKDSTVDFVISSHCIEHFYDPIKSVKEWLRVTKPGGYVYIIAPHKERTFDKDRPRTPLAELLDRHEHPNPPVPDTHEHYSVWITEDFLELCAYMQWPVVAFQDVDDKVGNGFTIVIQKP